MVGFLIALVVYLPVIGLMHLSKQREANRAERSLLQLQRTLKTLRKFRRKK